MCPECATPPDQGLPALYTNLLSNPGFESGVAGWSTILGATTGSSGPAPFSGGSYFFAGQNPQGFAEQVIDLQAFGFTPAQLDSQDLVVVFGGRIRTLDQTPRDQGQIKLDFLDSSNAVIGVGGLGSAQNLVDRWELVGGRLHLPQGTRTLRFRFEANRQSGSDNDSFLDGAFTYVLNDTVAPNQGAYGNTTIESSEPRRPHIAIRYPDLYTDWQRDTPRLIRWESYNNVTESNVRIDLYQDLAGQGPTLLLTIANSTADDGEFSWTPSVNGIGYGTFGLRIQVSLVDDSSVVDRSTEKFAVPESGDTYWVDDASNVNDEYTPNATGDNRNTGKRADAPKPNPINVLRIYELTSGSVLNVDTGSYPLLYTAVMTSKPGIGLGTDRGFLFRGPSDPGRTAELTTAIPNNASETLLFLDDADLMQVRFLTLTGGKYGLYATDGSTGFIGERLTVRDNAQHGILFDSASDFTLLKDITAHGHAGYDGLSLNGGAGGVIQNLVSYDNRYGLYASGLATLTVNGAEIFSNAWTGLRQEGGTSGSFDALKIYSNGTGIDTFGPDTISNSDIYDNVGNGINSSSGNLIVQNSRVHGNLDGIALQGGGQIVGSRIYGNVGVGIRASASPITVTGNVIYSNQYAIAASGYNGGTFTIANNLIYEDSVVAIRLASTVPSAYEIVNNTIYEPVAHAIYATSSDNVHLRNNIIWTQAGYGIYIANDSQADFVSNFNDLYATGTGKVGFWQGDRATLVDWQFANFRDGDSLSADPLFVNPQGADAILGAPNVQGLTASYYADRNWVGPPAVTRVERQINFQGYGTPDSILPNDNWSGIWQGFINLDRPGDYTFYINSLGPQQLSVNGQTLVNDTSDPQVERAVTYHANSAGWVSFVYQMADDGDLVNARVDWATPISKRATLLPGQIATTNTFLDGSDDNFHEQSLYGSYKPGLGFTNTLGQPLRKRKVNQVPLQSPYALANQLANQTCGDFRFRIRAPCQIRDH